MMSQAPTTLPQSCIPTHVHAQRTSSLSAHSQCSDLLPLFDLASHKQLHPRLWAPHSLSPTPHLLIELITLSGHWQRHVPNMTPKCYVPL